MFLLLPYDWCTILNDTSLYSSYLVKCTVLVFKHTDTHGLGELKLCHFMWSRGTKENFILQHLLRTASACGVYHTSKYSTLRIKIISEVAKLFKYKNLKTTLKTVNHKTKRIKEIALCILCPNDLEGCTWINHLTSLEPHRVFSATLVICCWYRCCRNEMITVVRFLLISKFPPQPCVSASYKLQSCFNSFTFFHILHLASEQILVSLHSNYSYNCTLTPRLKLASRLSWILHSLLAYIEARVIFLTGNLDQVSSKRPKYLPISFGTKAFQMLSIPLLCSYTFLPQPLLNAFLCNHPNLHRAFLMVKNTVKLWS